MKTSPIKTFISNRVVMFHLKRKRGKIIMACIKLKAYQPREEEGKIEERKKEFCMINGILGLVAVLVKHNWS